jgi:two-component system, chemotaxis family, protein-glutamate methylesterase/glutaminase
VPESTENDDLQRSIEEAFDAQERGDRSGESSIYSCPDCGGVLWQFDEGDAVQFACHTGHRWTPEHLVASQSEALAEALFTSMRLLNEQSALLRQLAATAAPGTSTSNALLERARQHDARATVIRKELLQDAALNHGRGEPATDPLFEIVRQTRRRPDD